MSAFGGKADMRQFPQAALEYEQQKSRSAGIRRFAAIRRTSSFVSNFIPTGSVIDGVGVV